jgi:hypothetical protein
VIERETGTALAVQGMSPGGMVETHPYLGSHPF